MYTSVNFLVNDKKIKTNTPTCAVCLRTAYGYWTTRREYPLINVSQHKHSSPMPSDTMWLQILVTVCSAPEPMMPRIRCRFCCCFIIFENCNFLQGQIIIDSSHFKLLFLSSSFHSGRVFFFFQEAMMCPSSFTSLEMKL